MILLAIDTSTDRAALALAGDAGRIRADSLDSGRRHGRDLIPRIGAILAAAGVSPKELGAVAVGLGPGSYTGLRVGVTAAKALAYATGAALVGLESLHAIARNAPTGATRVSVIADAQRGALYVADLLRPSPGTPWTPRAPTRVESLSDWLAGLSPETFVLGPALASARVRSAIPAGSLRPDDEDDHPRGEHLIAMAREALDAGRRDDPWLLEPLYLRRSAAEDQWDARREVPPA